MEHTVEQEIKFGLANEQPVINILKVFFNEDIEKTCDKYCPYDAISNNCKYEIKTRRLKYSSFPTTIISLTKLDVKGNLRFVFSFTDGLFYIDYDKELFKTFEIRHIKLNRLGAFPKLHIYIPIELLKKIIV